MNCPKRSFSFLNTFQIILVLVLLSSCSKSTSSIQRSSRSNSSTPSRVSSKSAVVAKKDIVSNDRAVVIKTARNQLGKNYKYAGSGPNHWDCSGLTSAAYRAVNITLPRTSRDMAKLGKDISVKNAQPGDLIFYKKEGRVFHVSVITENAKGKLWVVHSTTSRGVIEEDVLASTYWKKKIYKVISLAALKKRQ